MENNNEKRIKVLPLEEIFFVKKIKLENSYFSGVLCYARRLFEGYKMNNEENNNDNLIWGPAEEMYPSDLLDKEILKQVKLKFSNAECQTSLMMLDLEKANNINWYSNLQKEIMHISIEYIPTQYPYEGAQIYQKDIEIFYIPSSMKRQKRLNTNIVIVKDQINDFNMICSLLKDTYITFTNACKIQ